MSYLRLIKAQLKAEHSLYAVVAWHLMRLQKFLKIGFKTPRGKDNTVIDLFLVTINKDFPTLPYVIEAAKKHVQHQINNVYIVTRHNEQIKTFCQENSYHFIDEITVLGYGKEAIDYKVDGIDRSGWLFQQLLKFHGDTIVQSENYLSICTDTILICPHKFLDKGRIIFRQNEEWHTPYFTNFAKVFGYKTKTWFSYTSHMMLFNKTMMRQLKAELETKHAKPWDQVYIDTKNENINEQSCISDYDTYANWIRCNYPNQVKSIPLYNATFSRTRLAQLPELEKTFKHKYHSVSFHAHATPQQVP